MQDSDSATSSLSDFGYYWTSVSPCFVSGKMGKVLLLSKLGRYCLFSCSSRPPKLRVGVDTVRTKDKIIIVINKCLTEV